jgi:hypothetical protein
VVLCFARPKGCFLSKNTENPFISVFFNFYSTLHRQPDSDDHTGAINYVTGGALPRRQACGENVRHSKLSLLEKRV